jgi:hypothetical protein
MGTLTLRDVPHHAGVPVSKIVETILEESGEAEVLERTKDALAGTREAWCEAFIAEKNVFVSTQRSWWGGTLRVVYVNMCLPQISSGFAFELFTVNFLLQYEPCRIWSFA